MDARAKQLLAAGTTLVVAEPALALAHQGGLGAVFGLGLGIAAYYAASGNERETGEKTPSPVSLAASSDILHRLFRGKSVREQGMAGPQQVIEPLQPRSEQPADDDLLSLEDIIQQSDGSLPGPCVFSTALRAFTPTREQIFLGYLPGGQAVYVTLEDLCHVALAGLTGNGKTTLMRLLVSQLEYVGAKVLILNPHYTSYDIKKHEDWTPIERHLYRPPVTDFAAIGGVMKWVATVLLRDRMERYRQSISWGEPIFVVIDELPAIVKQVPEFPEYVSAILREGRKVDILLIVASQDFLARTVGPDEGGAVRKNYKTKMYVGGDVTTAKVLLDIPPAQIPEDALGSGVIMMRNQAVKRASLARVPYVDNKALYQLLGPSTYVPSEQQPQQDIQALPLAGSPEDVSEPPTTTAPRLYHRVPEGATHERKMARVQRLRNTPVVASEQPQRDETPEARLSEDERRVLEAYRDGAKTGMAIKAVTGIAGTRVNECLHKLTGLGLIDWQPRQR